LLLLSQHVETHHAMRLISEFQAGVGYLLKDRVSDLDSFAANVRRVADGDCVIDPELVARLVDKKRAHDPLDELTERERTVLGLMAQGLSNSALSTELHLSGKTVEAHVHLHEAEPGAGRGRSPPRARCTRLPTFLTSDHIRARAYQSRRDRTS